MLRKATDYKVKNLLKSLKSNLPILLKYYLIISRENISGGKTNVSKTIYRLSEEVS